MEFLKDRLKFIELYMIGVDKIGLYLHYEEECGTVEIKWLGTSNKNRDKGRINTYLKTISIEVSWN